MAFAIELPQGLRSYRRLILPALLLLALLLLFTMPARVLLSIVDPGRAGVFTQGVSGPWYSATVQRVRVMMPAAAVDLTDVRWRVKPLSLLRGRLMLALNADFAQRPVQASVGVGMGGRAFVQQLRASLPISEFTPLMTQLMFPIDGQINVRDVSLEWYRQWPAALSGEAQLSKVTLTTPAEMLAVGDILLDLAMQDGDVLVSITENRGPLGLGGELRLLRDNRFGLLLTSTPSDQMSRELRQQMQMMLGTPDNGTFSLRYDGRW